MGSRIPHPQTPVEVRRAFQRLKDVFFDDSSDVDHDLTTNFVANEHIDHTAVSVIAGTGLTGGGTIEGDVTINFEHLGLEDLADPGADRIFFWDESANASKWLALDASLTITDTTLSVVAGSVDHGGLLGLGDDDHAQYLLADGTRALSGNMVVDAGVTIDGRDISVDGAKLDGIEALADVTDATNIAAAGAAMAGGAFHDGFSDFVADEHIDHTSVTLTAGSGISGGGTIAANRTFNLDINGLAAATPAVAADTFPFYDETAGGNRKITFANLNSSLAHDDLSGYDSEKHIPVSTAQYQFLQATNGTGTNAWTLTPTLGGNLDVKTHKIVTTTTNGNIALEPHGSGVVTTTKGITGPGNNNYVQNFHGYYGKENIVHLAGNTSFSGTAYIGYMAAYTYVSRGYTAGNASLIVGPAAMAVGQTVAIIAGDCELSSTKNGGNFFKCLTAAGSNGNFVIVGYDTTTTFRDKFVIINGASSEVYIGPYSGMFGIQGDTQKFYLGVGRDFTQWYDGTDSHLDPRNVGTGDLYLDRGSFAFTAGSAQFADITSDPTPITAHVAIYNKGGDLTVKDNDGLVSAVKDVYGSLYVSHGSLTIAVTNANTAYEITTGLLTGSVLQGTTFGGNHYVAVDHPGTYLINWGLSVDTTTPADEIEGGIMVDGAARDDCSSHTTIVAGAKSGAMSATAIIALTANQQVSLFVENKTNTNDIVIEHASLTIVRIGE